LCAPFDFDEILVGELKAGGGEDGVDLVGAAEADDETPPRLGLVPR
jgi:hypothetical protein